MCTVHVDKCHTYWYEIIKSIVIYCGRKCNTPILITPFLVLKVLPINNQSGKHNYGAMHFILCIT